jgi:hypothetical protein
MAMTTAMAGDRTRIARRRLVPWRGRVYPCRAAGTRLEGTTTGQEETMYIGIGTLVLIILLILLLT